LGVGAERARAVAKGRAREPSRGEARSTERWLVIV
jgi:hypothetical protein